MDLLTAKQAIEKWGISARRVTRLCEEGRIEGAAKIAGVWLMPADASKPSDARIKSGNYIKKKDKNV